VLFKDAIHLIPERYQVGIRDEVFRDTMEQLANMQGPRHFFVAGFAEPGGDTMMADPQAEMLKRSGAERHTRAVSSSFPCRTAWGSPYNLHPADLPFLYNSLKPGKPEPFCVQVNLPESARRFE
jgi:hypothetical protein